MNKLLSKQGQSVTQLAKLLIRAKHADRLPSIQTIATEFGASVGTVQAAMQYLQANDIIEVESRGRLGAFVRSLDYIQLWSLAYSRTMIGMLPMPYSKRIEGLATGLRQCFEAAGLNIDMRFMRGSTARIQQLHSQRCDWVMTSRYGLDTARIQGFEVEPILEMGKRTFTVDQVLIIRGGQTLQPGMRVGIDTQSVDHAYVVRLASRGIPVTFVEIDYSTGIDQLLQGQIDATVWTEHDLPVLPDDITLEHLSEANRDETVLGQLAQAVIVGQPGSIALTNVLQTTINVSEVDRIQIEVIDGLRRPTY